MTDVVADLQAKLIASLSGAVEPGSRVGLIDFPLHLNAGDTLIWLGEKAWADGAGIDFVRVRHREAYSKAVFADLDPAAPILIHGGGNFGDLYPEHQVLRRQVLADFADRRVVQLPQTLSVRDPAAFVLDRQAIEKHGGVTLMWRDTRSLALGQEMFPTADSRLVPDAAFALGRVHGPEDAPGGQLCLAREDREAGALAAARPADVAHGDWKLSPLRRAAYTPLWRGSHGLTAIEASGRQVPEAVWSAVYATVAQNNFACATRLLANRSAVVTDRLHGHILCTLLRVPHVLVDDRYGKTSSFYQTWTAEDPLSVLVPAHEAFAAAGRLTARITATADA